MSLVSPGQASALIGHGIVLPGGMVLAFCVQNLLT